MKLTRINVVKISILLVLASLLIVGGWEIGRHYNLWGEPNALRIIKAEKMASKDLLGLKLVESSQRGEGSLVKKTVSPSVSRTFEVSPDEIDQTRSKIIRMAEEDGWKKRDYQLTTVPNIFMMQKNDKNGSEIILSIETSKSNIAIGITGY